MIVSITPYGLQISHVRRCLSRTLLCVVLLSSASFAAQEGTETAAANTNYSIEIQADSAVFDEQKKLIQYDGSVIMRQGPLKISADSITIMSDDDGVTELIAKGNPVRYHQTKTATVPSIKAEADSIHYFKIDERMELTGQAFLEQNGQSFRAPRIEYRLTEQTLKALGHSADGPKGRVIMVIPPRTTQ